MDGARREAIRLELAADSSHRPARAWRVADGTASDASPAAGQTAAHRDCAADFSGGLCERVLEPASFQRRIRRPLSNAANAFSEDGHRGQGLARRDLYAAAVVSSAV